LINKTIDTNEEDSAVKSKEKPSIGLKIIPVKNLDESLTTPLQKRLTQNTTSPLKINTNSAL
jgi:hypothetical protein